MDIICKQLNSNHQQHKMSILPTEAYCVSAYNPSCHVLSHNFVKHGNVREVTLEQMSSALCIDAPKIPVEAMDDHMEISIDYLLSIHCLPIAYLLSMKPNL